MASYHFTSFNKFTLVLLFCLWQIRTVKWMCGKWQQYEKNKAHPQQKYLIMDMVFVLLSLPELLGTWGCWLHSLAPLLDRWLCCKKPKCKPQDISQQWNENVFWYTPREETQALTIQTSQLSLQLVPALLLESQVYGPPKAETAESRTYSWR